jgi:hypothetical protein
MHANSVTSDCKIYYKYVINESNADSVSSTCMRRPTSRLGHVLALNSIDLSDVRYIETVRISDKLNRVPLAEKFTCMSCHLYGRREPETDLRDVLFNATSPI